MLPRGRASVPPLEPRPHSARRLVSTASKLAEDARRPARTLQSPCKSEHSEVMLAASDVELWRRAFHEEAQSCVQAMQEIFRSADPQTFSTRFEDWRQADIKATAQLQHHVKHLARLNESLGAFLQSCAAPQELTRFKSTVMELAAGIETLQELRGQLCGDMEQLAEQAALRVAQCWQTEASRAASALAEQVELQERARKQQAESQSVFGFQLQQLSSRIQELREAVQENSQVVVELRQQQLESTGQLLSGSADLQEELKGQLQASGQAWEASMQRHAAEHLEACTTSLLSALSGSAQPEPFRAAVERWSEALEQLQTGSLREAAELQRDGSELKLRLQDCERQLELWQQQAQDGQRQAASLEDRLTNLASELQATRSALTEAQAVSFGSSMRRLKELEARGRVKVNRQSGKLSFSEDDKALGDVAEVVQLLALPGAIEVCAKVPKGQSKDDVLKVAISRAELVLERLEKLGARDLSTRAQVAPNEMLSIQFDRDLFVVSDKQSSTRR